MRGDGKADGRINARQFFDDRRIFDVAHACAAVLFGNENAEDAEFGKLRSEFDREVRRFVPFGDVRPQFCFGKFTDGSFDLLLLFIQLEIHLSSGALAISHQSLHVRTIARRYELIIVHGESKKIMWGQRASGAGNYDDEREREPARAFFALFFFGA